MRPLSALSGNVAAMSDFAEVLMLSGVAHICPDCLEQRIFVPADECDIDRCEFCCTSCGAAIVIDPLFDYPLAVTRVA